ncbi:MAG: addiction module protein [Isosphaeraceae bacterium]
MGSATEQVLRADLALPKEERLDLVEALLASHAPPADLPFDSAGLAEVQRRSAEVETGTVLLDTWSVVHERVRRRLEGRARG